MKFKNQKISSQILISIIIHIGFVIILGFISMRHASHLHDQTKTLYEHPLAVRVAVNKLNTDIVTMRLGTRDIMLAKTNDEYSAAEEIIATANADAELQFFIIRDRYLGPVLDVENAYRAFHTWNAARNTNIERVKNNKANIEDIKIRVTPAGYSGKLRSLMLRKIEVVDDFSKNNGMLLYNNSEKLRQTLNLELFVLLIIILGVSLVLNYYLIRNIRNSISELTEVARKFKNGDLDARVHVDAPNEFGLLSDTFNSLATRVQQNISLNELEKKLAGLMLRETNAQEFFKILLPELARITNSQIASIHFLNTDTDSFELFNSIGLAKDTLLSFRSSTHEGEFGICVVTRKIQKTSKIPHDTSFILNTIGGSIIPREIITIPLLKDNQVFGIISLAAVRRYSDSSEMLIHNIYNTLNARIEGVLAYQKLKEFSRKLETQSAELENQNQLLETQKTKLRELNRLKSGFLSNMSHELRTPLNSVIALSGVLNRNLAGKIDKEFYSYLEVIERNGQHLLSIINDILDFSRIESGKEKIQYSVLALNETLHNICELVKPLADEKGIALLSKLPEKEIYFETDTKKFRHIVQNIIANAVKFTTIGQVELSLKEDSKNIYISISDTGIGINPQSLEHIFDEFRQADDSTSKRFGGTGLGLSIARKYSLMLHGDISVKSSVGEGSVFTLTLPIQKTNTLAENAENTANKKHIWCVKTDLESASLRPYFDTSEYIFTEIQYTPEEPIDWKQVLPEIILLQSGWEEKTLISALNDLKNEKKSTNVPLIGILSSNKDFDTVFLNNFDAVIKEPLKKTDLLNTINKALHEK